MNTKKLKIDWLDNCPKCERSTVTVSTVKGSLEKLFDGDKVECWCGQTGVIDTGDNNAWVEWDEVVSSNKDNHDAYYREKYPDFWNRLPGCNHQAWTHYETSLNSWLVALHRAEAKLEGCVVVPSNSVTLTCEQLLTVLQYGAPDLHVERTEYSEEQMETEMSIVWLEDGHSGKGYYAYYTELPEEGSINIDLMEEAARGGNE